MLPIFRQTQLLSIFTQLRFHKSIAQQYFKLRVSCYPEKYTVFIKDNTTIGQFDKMITQKIFPHRNIVRQDFPLKQYPIQAIFLNSSLEKLQTQVSSRLAQIKQKGQINTQQYEVNIQNNYTIQAIVSRVIRFFEIDANKTIVTQVGIELVSDFEGYPQFKNIPSYIMDNILLMRASWQQKKTVQQAKQIPKELIELDAQQLQIRASIANNVPIQLKHLINFKQNEYYNVGKGRGLMKKILSAQAINFMFLFWVTYGKYGWDVGQPLSYLSTLCIELLSIMNIFELQQSIKLTGQKSFEQQLNKSAVDQKISVLKWQLNRALKLY